MLLTTFISFGILDATSTFGQFIAGMVDGIFIELFPNDGWRYMLGLAAIPALVMFYGFWSLPESPRWLALQGEKEIALLVLQSVRESDQEAVDELNEILRSVTSQLDDSIFGDTRSEAEQVQNDIINDNAEDDGNETALEYGTVSRTTIIKNEAKGSFSLFIEMISDAPTRRALILGCGLMVVQQCSGINTYVSFIHI
jgi:MFS transporter, SP family, solute carrier family 2 (myo-inositol transporter), member 13